ncbi:MAG: HAD family hydrolase [SAR324 cluster bacterium]|nr:HAD family hydrolase [SAR324 cluster bacterium]
MKKELLQAFPVIFWDFDGVIKESVDAKTQAFRALFVEYGVAVQDLVQQHHEQNGGLSRFQKIPLYYENFLNKTLTSEEIILHCNRFGELAVQSVLESPWVDGVAAYLEKHYLNQTFFLISATPHEEIIEIASRLKIQKYFQEIRGSSHDAKFSKATVLGQIINQRNYAPEQCLMIGDSWTDYEAAKKNNVTFLLRETNLNHSIFASVSCERISHFKQLI